MNTLPDGLTLLPDFITEEEETQLLQHINDSEWNTSLKRRTQHYGFEYNYTDKSATKRAQPLPEWTEPLCERLNPYFKQHPEQLIVNEYTPGQGIAAHIDRIDAFGPVIVSVSLGSDIIMDFSRNGITKELLLPRRSALVLERDARYKWFHGIAARKKDHGKERGTRVSLTFRTMKKKREMDFVPIEKE
jgi:alkylated DNA repair dioxygenase AlkB